MRLLDLTLDTPAENLALDEALLLDAERSSSGEETLRLWEPADYFVVLGRSSKIDQEVDREECRRRRVEVFRRISGGASILAGPGCLMYAVVLDLRRRPELRMIDRAHATALSQLRDALSRLIPGVEHLGTSDVAIGGRKVSGNSVRIGRDHILYHGTLLHDFSLGRVAACLKTPPRQPDYRQGRDHADFIANLDCDAESLKLALVQQWGADDVLTTWPVEVTRRLTTEKYNLSEWTNRH